MSGLCPVKCQKSRSARGRMDGADRRRDELAKSERLGPVYVDWPDNVAYRKPLLSSFQCFFRPSPPGVCGGLGAEISPPPDLPGGGHRTNSASLALTLPFTPADTHEHTRAHTHTDVSCSGPSPLGATRTLCPSISLHLPFLHSSLLCPEKIGVLLTA